MTAIVIIITATLLCLFAIMAATSWLMNKLMKTYIGTKHQLLEEIIQTGQVPERWSSSYRSKAAKRTDEAEAAAQLAEKAVRRYIRKLDRLTDYVKKTRLVEDEETRLTLLADLARIRSQWREGRRHEQPAASK